MQLFSLLKINPSLSELLIDIVSTSPELAEYLSRNAAVFDAVIGGDFFSDWPGEAALRDALSDALKAEGDYEARLDATRRWAREWHFRVGVHHLRGLTDAATAGVQYADLARAVLQALWPVVVDEFARKHGTATGAGRCVGRHGVAGRAASDCDL